MEIVNLESLETPLKNVLIKRIELGKTLGDDSFYIIATPNMVGVTDCLPQPSFGDTVYKYYSKKNALFLLWALDERFVY
jgi:hypothetical protein